LADPESFGRMARNLVNGSQKRISFNWMKLAPKTVASKQPNFRFIIFQREIGHKWD
jgi:uncharacterized protein (DUF736 family)